MKRLKYDKSLNQVQRLFEEPDFAWKTKRKKKTKTDRNTKFLPIFNGRNKKNTN